MQTVEVKGLKELSAALAELSRGVARNALRGSVRAAAAVIRDETKRNAPVLTGQLKRSVYLKHLPERSGPTGQTFRVGVRRGKKYQGLKTKGGKDRSMDAYYAPFVEFGHFTRRSKTGTARMLKNTNRGQRNNAALAEMVQTGEVRWVPPRPFMRPAWDAHQNAALKALQDYLTKRIPEEAAKARR